MASEKRSIAKDKLSMANILDRIKSKEHWVHKDLAAYTSVLESMLQFVPWHTVDCVPITVEVIDGLLIIKNKLNDDLLNKTFPQLTDLLGRFLTDEMCTKYLFSRIYHTWISVVPDCPEVRYTCIMDNVALFTHMFEQLRNASNFVYQEGLVQLLIAYAKGTSLSSHLLLSIACGPFFDCVRHRFIANDVTSQEIVKVLNDEQLLAIKVVSLVARRGRLGKSTEIRPIMVNGIAADLLVNFNLDCKPSVSCWHVLMQQPMQTVESIEIAQHRIKKIMLKECRSNDGELFFTMSLKFTVVLKLKLTTETIWAKSMQFQFSEDMIRRLFLSPVLAAMKIYCEWEDTATLDNTSLGDMPKEFATQQSKLKRTKDAMQDSSCGPSVKKQRLTLHKCQSNPEPDKMNQYIDDIHSRIVKLAEKKSKMKCWYCGHAASQLCSGCKLAIYCGVGCQNKDWSTHRKMCPISPPTLHSSVAAFNL